MTLVSMGNPHVIFVCDDPWAVPLKIIGPKIENHSWFPNRINVHFVKFEIPSTGTPDETSSCIMRTWERGSGITLACGTGATAVCVAGVLLGLCSRTLIAKLPGG